MFIAGLFILSCGINIHSLVVHVVETTASPSEKTDTNISSFGVMFVLVHFITASPCETIPVVTSKPVITQASYMYESNLVTSESVTCNPQVEDQLGDTLFSSLAYKAIS